MATVIKTSIRRYNNTDWDSIYLQTSADIVSLGSAKTLTGTATAFTADETIPANTTVDGLLERVVNRMAAIEGTVIPGVVNGGTTKVYTTALDGVISRANLPNDVGGKVVVAADEATKNGYTGTTLNVGDIVKVTGGKVYIVSSVDATTKAVTYEELTDSASSVAWSRLTGVPTVIGTGTGQINLTNAVKTGDLMDAAGADAKGTPVKTNATDGKLHFDITGDAATLESHAASYFATASALTNLETNVIGAVSTNVDHTNGTGILGDIEAIQLELRDFDATNITKGKLPLSVIPEGAVEKCVVVLNDTARFALTTAEVQTGDTVKVQQDANGNPAPKMYFVVDDTKLNLEDGYEVYVAGAASSVEWAGVLNTPTTLAGYGITDAVNTSDVVTTATANKILRLDSNGKLPTSITGDAATLGTHAASYFATATALETLQDSYDNTVEDLEELTAVVNGRAADGTHEAVTGLVTKVANLEGAIGDTSTSGTILYDIAHLKDGTLITALNLNSTALTGKVARANLPDDVGGAFHAVADLTTAQSTLTTSNTYVGDLVKLTNGKVYVVTDTSKLDSNDGYTLLVDVSGSTITWSQIDSTTIPTTVGSGTGQLNLTNVLLTTDAITDALDSVADIAGKMVKVHSDRTLHANITGSASQFDGHDASYYATADELADVAKRAPELVSDINEVEDATTGTMVLLRLS